jgi:hypothetical protein
MHRELGSAVISRREARAAASLDVKPPPSVAWVSLGRKF